MRLRVGLVCHWRFGGSVRTAVGLAEALADRGHLVHLFARRPPLGGEPPRGVAFHALPAEPDPALHRQDLAWSPDDIDDAARRIAAIARRNRLDVLHFHYGIPFAWLSVEARRRAGAPGLRLVGTLHGTDVSGHGDVGRNDDRLEAALRHVDVATTVSRSHAELISARWFDRVPVVIPNFVDTRLFRPAPHRRNRTRRPVVAHVSNFRRVKNPEAVARIFARLRRTVDAELWLIGDGERMPHVERILGDAGVLYDVRRYGFRNDVHAILPHADALLLASHTESFCLAALEAAACGVPTVAPRIGGIPEIVREGATGILYEPGDEEAAAGALRSVLEPARRRRMGISAARWARRFAPDAVVPRYEELYRRLIVGAEPQGGEPIGGGPSDRFGAERLRPWEAIG